MATWHIILGFCFYHLLRGVQELCLVSCWQDLLWVSSCHRFLGDSTKGFAKMLPCGVFSSGYQVKFQYFLRWIFLYFVLLFHLVHNSWLRLAIGYFYWIFSYIFVLVLSFEWTDYEINKMPWHFIFYNVNKLFVNWGYISFLERFNSRIIFS